MKIFFIILTFLICQSGLYGQVNLYTLQPSVKSYKELQKASKADGIPLLVILYAPHQIVSSHNTFQKVDSILSASMATWAVINLERESYLPIIKYIDNISKPTWIYLHPDGMVVNVNNSIIADNSLIEFINNCEGLYKSFDNIYKVKGKSKSLNDQLALIRSSINLKDRDYVADLLNKYIKRLDARRLSDNSFKELIDLGIIYPYSSGLNKLISKNKDRAISLSSEREITFLQKDYILHDLKNKQLLEPYYVWPRYDKELGYYADSLYRIFALGFFSSLPDAKDELYSEAFDYLEIYPRSPWPLLDQLYSKVIPDTKDIKDLEILLDLISFQIFREENYKKLDYKAAILYKMGQKERALNMIEEVTRMALESGVRYKSILYSLK